MRLLLLITFNVIFSYRYRNVNQNVLQVVCT